MLSYLFDYYTPASVVDIGCGVGVWLAAAHELGASEVVGIDGDYVDGRLLRIPDASFVAADLERAIDLQVKADLCICVEVAEHLSIGRASSLVSEMIAFAPVVLFGAAIPGQGGTHHVNLQWPSFWAELFEQNGYVALDVVRGPFWDDREVAWCYAQNTLLYCDRKRPDIRRLLELMPAISPPGLPMVHPALYNGYLYELEHGSVRSQFRRFRRALGRAVGKRIGFGARVGGPLPFLSRGTDSPGDHDG